MKTYTLLIAVLTVSTLLLATPIVRAQAEPLNFVAPLSGAQEVPARDTHGRGLAKFMINPDGSTIEFRLIVANIENVIASHIHVAPAGVNGPVVLFLYGPAAPGGGRTNGVLSLGSATAANLVGPLVGQPLSALVDAMMNGNAYVNVHTSDGVDPANTGPGDFPGGEIRGQIALAD